MALLSTSSTNSTPKKSRRDKKNPFSDRGLDKFSALLTDLEEKRQKIYSQTDPQNIVLVRFAYKNPDECIPVVVKQRDKKEEKQPIATYSKTIEKVPIEVSSITAGKESRLETQMNKKKILTIKVMNLKRWISKPSYYVTAIVILTLFLLSLFGKSVTILCVSLLWYSVPVLKVSSKSRSPTQRMRTLTPNKKAKDGLSSSSSSSPKNDCSEKMKDKSSCVLGHRQSL